MKKCAANSAFYKIFGLSFERLKQLMFRENEKDIGKTTVDSWGPLRLPFHFELIKTKDNIWNYLIHDCMSYNGTSYLNTNHQSFIKLKNDNHQSKNNN